MGNREIAVGLIAIATIVALVAMLSPWWSVETSADFGEFGDGSRTNSAGPFDSNDDMIAAGSATLTGILSLLGMLAMAGGVGLLVYSMATGKSDAMTKNAPLIVLGGSALIVLALVLAIFMYPSEMKEGGMDIGFWGSQEFGQGITFTAFAAWGWYMAIAAVAIGAAGAALGLKQETGARDSAREESAAEGQES